MAWSTGRAVRRIGLALVLGLVVGGLALTTASTASAQTLQDIEVRDKLIANQEALLNTYRCMFSVDTQVVPGGCSNVSPALPPQEPGQFSGTPTARDIAVRDQLITDQEALLNVYRCQFSIDTELVPAGCQSHGTQPEPEVTAEPTPTTPENLGPVPPNEEAWSENLRIREFMVACGFWEGIYGQCHNHPEDTDKVAQLKGELYDCEWSFRERGCRGYGGAGMRQLEDELFCQDSWIFRRSTIENQPPYFCYHPDHPTNGVNAPR